MVLTNTNEPVYTLTFDNHMVFSEYQFIDLKLAPDTYFTRPYKSQDKGTL